MKIKIPREYLLSLRYYLLFSSLLFIISVGIGYVFAQNSPTEVRELLEQIRLMLEPIQKMSEVQQVFVIFLNNVITGFCAILLGIILGLFPALVIFANGELLGILMSISREAQELATFFTGIFPHGIIEIPVLIFCASMGIKIGKKSVQKIFKKKVSIKEELKSALLFFFQFLTPLLLLAAIIEIFITREILFI